MNYTYAYQNLTLVDMDGELWKPIKGYEEYYMASNLGRIKWLSRWIYYTDGRKRFVGEKILTQYIHHSKSETKTLFVHLNIEKVRNRMIVARVIYSTFVKPVKSIKAEFLYVLHKSLDVFDNRVENLYLATAKELTKRNIEEGFNKNLISTPEIREKVTSRKRKPILQYTLTGEFICSYPSIREAERKTGVDNKSIIGVAKGKYKQARGFIWKYQKEQNEKLQHETV